MGSSGRASSSRSVAEQHGVLAESLDMGDAVNSVLPVSGTLYAVRLYVPKATPITNIVMVAAAPAGSGLTAGQNLAALCDDAGNVLQSTADQSTAWASTGAKIMPLAAPVTPTADTFYRVAFLTVGTTPPTFRCGASSSATVSAGLASGAALRFGVGGTGLTAIPANISPAGLTPGPAAWAVLLT